MTAHFSKTARDQLMKWLEQHHQDARSRGDHKIQRIVEMLRAVPDMLDALQLGVEYDDLLLRFKGPTTIFDGDVVEIDAAYDKWATAARAAIAKAVLI